MIPIVEVDAERLGGQDAADYAETLATHAEKRPWIVLWPNGEIVKSAATAPLRDCHALWKGTVSPPPGDYLWSIRDQHLERLDFGRDVDRFRGALDGWLLDSVLTLRPYNRADYREPRQDAAPAGHPIDRIFGTATWLAAGTATAGGSADLVMFDKHLADDSLTKVKDKRRTHEHLAHLSGLLGAVVGNILDRSAFRHLDDRDLNIVLYSLEPNGTREVRRNIEAALSNPHNKPQAGKLHQAVQRCASGRRRVRIVMREMPGAAVLFHSRFLVVPGSGHVIELPWGFDGLWNFKSKVPGCDRPRLLLDTLKRLANPVTNPDLDILSQRIRADEEVVIGEIDLLDVAQQALASLAGKKQGASQT